MNMPLGRICAFVLFSASLVAAQEPPHPIMSVPGDATQADGILSGHTESGFLKFVPTWGPRNASYGMAPPVVTGDTGWTWSSSSPDQLTSVPSGTVFPNASFTTQFEDVPVLSGKTMHVPFYWAAGSTTKKSLVWG